MDAGTLAPDGQRPAAAPVRDQPRPRQSDCELREKVAVVRVLEAEHFCEIARDPDRLAAIAELDRALVSVAEVHVGTPQRNRRSKLDEDVWMRFRFFVVEYAKVAFLYALQYGLKDRAVRQVRVGILWGDLVQPEQREQVVAKIVRHGR